MTPKDVSAWIEATFDGLIPVNAWGEKSYFYNPNSRFSRGAYFCTLKEKDGDNDKASNLDRDGIWRLNFGLPKSEFQNLFGPPPKRPTKGDAIRGAWEFRTTDLLMPHPVYGWMGWVAVLNPSTDTFDACKPLMKQAYDKSVAGFEARVHKQDRKQA